MKTHFLLLIILFSSFGAPLYAQDSDSTQTPDSIGDPEQELIPDELEQPNPLSEVDTRLMKTAYSGKVAEVEVSVAKGANVNVQDNKGRAPLILAASKGHTSVVAFLVANGADVNLKDNDRQSPLMYAAKGSFGETAAYLLENGAEVNVQSKKKGITALMLAAVSDNVELVRMLLQHGSDADMTDSLGRSALILAEKKGNSAVVELLSEPKSEPQSEPQSEP
jgi:ankyrin repeat protein